MIIRRGNFLQNTLNIGAVNEIRKTIPFKTFGIDFFIHQIIVAVILKHCKSEHFCTIIQKALLLLPIPTGNISGPKHNIFQKLWLFLHLKSVTNPSNENLFKFFIRIFFPQNFLRNIPVSLRLKNDFFYFFIC